MWMILGANIVLTGILMIRISQLDRKTDRLDATLYKILRSRR